MAIRWLRVPMLCSALLAACGHAPVAAPVAPAVPEANIEAKPEAKIEAKIDAMTDAMVGQRSHEVLDAWDRGDTAALEAVLAPGFVKFENQHVVERAKLVDNAKGRPLHAPDMTRAWKDEHVYRRDGDALFIGMAMEHETGNDSHGNREYDGWYTMSWVRDNGTWKVAHWSWVPHRTSIENARDMWNDNYRQSIGFTHEPNRLLVETVRGKKPGAALDLMTGQGRNAVYLATRGWRVTGVDIADEGLRLAREAATAKRVEVATVSADAETYDFGTAKWDLVTMIYAPGSPAMIERAKASLKPGGMFVLEFFLRVEGETGGFEQGQLAKLFDTGFDIVRDDVVEDVPDWAKDRAKLVRFVARKR